MIDFIGVGAQKSGTSWVHACLYEHPEICSPVKEIHFFSRDRFSKGKAWYEDHFKRCSSEQKTGEFSTSYLFSESAAHRIHSLYPDVRLIAILRDPVSRAYSQYRNAIKAGEITEATTFETYADTEPSCVGQGFYFAQLKRYLELFSREQILIMVYEDSTTGPQAFMSQIYRHIGVDSTFVPPSLHTHINVARTPKQLWPERLMHAVAERLRRSGLDTFVWLIKRSGVPELVRKANTKPTKATSSSVTVPTTLPPEQLQAIEADTAALGELIRRDLSQVWSVGNT